MPDQVGRRESSSNQDFTIIQNSESGNALELFNSKNSIIRNNVVTGQDKFGVSIFAKGGVRSAQIYNNVVYNQVAEGLGHLFGRLLLRQLLL